MPLVHMTDMLDHAYRHGYAVGAYDLVDTLFLEGILAGVAAADAPVILSLAESHFDYYDLAPLMAATVAAARRSPVPVAIHLDHGASLDSAVRGINLGCTGVMVDASQQDYEANVAATAAVVAMAHGCGVPVEGELGYVPGVEGEDAERHPGEVIYTTPEQATDYVARTGVDCLAVSIGTVHGRMKGAPELDLTRLAAINSALGKPLVIHGGTGLSDQQFRDLIARGVTKINYYTALSDAAGKAIGEAAQRGATRHTALVAGVREAIAAEVTRTSRLWGAAGQGAAVRATARPWREVAHVIQWNTDGSVDAEEVERRMAHGHATLGAIPGVREVFTGHVLQQDARYQHCWVVRFSGPPVVESYKHHPDHVAYADTHFRPIAGDRMTLDYIEAGNYIEAGTPPS